MHFIYTNFCEPVFVMNYNLEYVRVFTRVYGFVCSHLSVFTECTYKTHTLYPP